MMIFHSYVKITRGYPIWSTLYFDPFIPQRKMYHKRAARHPETWLQWVAHPCPKRNIQNIQVAHSRVRSGLVQRQAVKHQKMTRRKVTPSIIKTHMWHVLSIAPFFGGLPQSYPSQCCTSWIMGCWETHIYPQFLLVIIPPWTAWTQKISQAHIYIYVYIYIYMCGGVRKYGCPKPFVFPLTRSNHLDDFWGTPMTWEISSYLETSISYIYSLYIYSLYTYYVYIYIYTPSMSHIKDCRIARWCCTWNGLGP